MDVLFWIIGSEFAIALIAWIGLFTLFLKEKILDKILLILVAFSAGSLLGGAFLHLIPETVAKTGANIDMFLWLLFGFSIFFLLEQFMHWHHCHKSPSKHKKPLTYLILIADGVHNFIDGLAIASSFLVGVPIGIITWMACVAHEVPQELGDFGILIYGGWKKMDALLFNFFSALTIIPGGLLVYYLSSSIDITFLLPFAAGNFIYIAASDLIPEIKKGEKLSISLTYFLFFVIGMLFILGVITAFKM